MPPLPLPNLDRLTYITPDAVEYMLSPPTWVLQEDGLGMPPIEYVTQRGPFQHGETVKNFFLRPRTIQLVVRKQGCSRSEYWGIRARLLDILRPGRLDPTTPGTLRKYMANGSVRDLSVYTSEGPGFPSHSDEVWDEWSIQDTIRFTAYDPILRDPSVKSASFSIGVPTGTFPITFPYQSSTFGTGTQAVNAGTWDSAPTIIITGPITGASITNITTNETITFNYALAAGQVATFDLNFGRKTVTLADGTNLIGYVSVDSDLGTFHFRPGTNQLQVFGTGTSGATSIVLQWFNRYIGA